MSSIEPSSEVSATIIRKPEPASSISTPWSTTLCGNSGSTRETAFCTSTWARATSVPGSKVAVICIDPELSETDS